MVVLIAVMAFTTIFIVTYMILVTYMPAGALINMRLKSLDRMMEGRTDIDEELAKPFAQRIISPLTGSMSSSLLKLTPQSIRLMVEQKLAMAGGFGGLSTDGFLLLSGILATLFPMVTVFMTILVGATHKAFGFGMIAFAFGISLPLLMLSKRLTARKKKIQKDLPEVLDLLTVSIEAGLGFDGALSKLAEKMKGALVDEFSRMLQEMRIGVARRDALHSLGRRCDVADLSLFTTALIQADQLGVSIGNVLRIQSASIREKRRQRAQEQALKAPVKMLIPLVVFIFPTLFVILLGPAAIQIYTSFSK